LGIYSKLRPNLLLEAASSSSAVLESPQETARVTQVSSEGVFSFLAFQNLLWGRGGIFLDHLSFFLKSNVKDRAVVKYTTNVNFQKTI
jgi:hypothetical protein